MSFHPYNWKATSRERANAKHQAAETLRNRGGNRMPLPPRSLIAQPASRSILLTWCADPSHAPSTHFRVYVGTENHLYRDLPATAHQCEIAATAGATPSPVNIFVSAFNPLTGDESLKIHITGSASPETAGSAPPPAPSPPSNWIYEPTGGAGNNSNLRIRG